MKKIIFIIILLSNFMSPAQPTSKIISSIENIMRNPKWIGVSPYNIRWSEDGSKIYFDWNPNRSKSDSLYYYSINDRKIKTISAEEQKIMIPQYGNYNKSKTKKLFERNGDLFILDVKSGKQKQLTKTADREYNPRYSSDEDKIIYMFSGNLYSMNLTTSEIVQIINFKKGNKPSETAETSSAQEKYLKQQQINLFDVLRLEKETREQDEKNEKLLTSKKIKEIYIQDKNINSIQLSPDELFVTFRMDKSPKSYKTTIVPNYVTESGFTEEINSRTKVGADQTSAEFFIYDIKRDTVYTIDLKKIDGIYDKPQYMKDYYVKRDTSKIITMTEKTRDVSVNGPLYSYDGKKCFVVVKSLDYKDRWLMLLDLRKGELKLLDRQHDEAWIGGPGIGWGIGSSGWLGDDKNIWFQSEESGYSHLYILNIETGEKKQLTNGKFEIFDPFLSNDKKYFYFTSNEIHPGERHFYKMPVYGGNKEKLSSMTGNNEVAISPDESRIAVRYSYSNKPWELFIAETKQPENIKQITFSTTEELKGYQLRDPQIVTFNAGDGEIVYARLFKPQNEVNNKAAVIFVHGAGYLQNAHKWWSDYFREFMFNNFLADNGYTVLDIDYRASSGYGRKWRTDIYRNMGGKDLSDHVDGANYLIRQHGVDPGRIGIYGGSYGGFITLMAMFKEPNIFKAGAALRPVTDWAHYNHGYTANILNVPQLDSLAYQKSSPIYFANGLKGALLICHGMVDDNVHFQDVIRLSQRLIELGKNNWEIAVYPVEGHGFVQPSSWTDEYKRIFKLFETNLRK